MNVVIHLTADAGVLWVVFGIMLAFVAHVFYRICLETIREYRAEREHARKSAS